LEKLLKKYEVFRWNHECDQDLNILKENMSTNPILIYPNWKGEFHVHIDASGIYLGVVLAQPSEGNLDHPIYFSSRNISHVEHNYTTTKKKGYKWSILCKSLDVIC
jgi:hypothetical protein